MDQRLRQTKCQSLVLLRICESAVAHTHDVRLTMPSLLSSLVVVTSMGALALGSSISEVPKAVADITMALETFGSAVNGSSISQHVGRRLATDTTIYVACGVDIPGYDISNRQSTSADGCAIICTTVSGCDAVTWTNHNGGTCWFKRLGNKDVYEVARPKAGAASYVTVPTWWIADNGVLGVQSGVDMPGNDIGSDRQSSWCGCPQACRANKYCFAFTWTDHNGGTCWLKSKAVEPVGKGGRTISVTMINFGYIGYCKP